MRSKGAKLSGVAALESPGFTAPGGMGGAALPSPGDIPLPGSRSTLVNDVPSLALLQRGLNPVVAAGALLLCTLAYKGGVPPIYLTLAGFVFFLSAYMVTEFPLTRTVSGLAYSRSLRRLCGQCVKLLAVVLLVGFATKSSNWY